MKKVLCILLLSTYSFSIFSTDNNSIIASDLEINLWPLFTYIDNDMGGKDLSALLLFNRKSDLEGDTRELSLFPLFYSSLHDDGFRFGSLLWFSGPDYWFLPPLLTGKWTRYSGDTSLWITPLYHLTKDSDGELISTHFLNYIALEDREFLVPLAWKIKRKNGIHHGFIPFYAFGPSYWTVPITLSASWKNWDKSRTTWITPIFHMTSDKEGDLTSSHFLNIYYNKDYDEKHWGIVPIWFQGGDYWFFPLGLSGHWDSYDREHTWLTPLFHMTSSTDESDFFSFHLLNGYYKREADEVDWGIFPLWFQGNDYWVTPPLLSGMWHNNNGESHTWITPLFHQKRDQSNELTAYHYLNYYSYQTEEGWKSGFAPFWYVGPDYLVSPLLLSGYWHDANQSEHLWITPLFHRTKDKEDKTTSFHLINFYSYTDEEEKHTSLFPLFFKGETYWNIPPLLIFQWENYLEEDNLWITPLFHRTLDSNNNLDNYHFLNFFAEDDGDSWKYNLVPILKVDKSGWFSPIIFTGYNKEFNHSSLWITPLFHLNRDNDDVSSWHLGPYIQPQKKSHILFPFAWYFGKERPEDDIHYGLLPLFVGGTDYFFSPLGYGYGEEDDFHFGLFPIFAKSPESLLIPPLLTAVWKDADGSNNRWITPLYHSKSDKNGNIEHMHLLNYFSYNDFSTLFPIYFKWDENYSSLIPPLIGLHSGEQLDDSILFDLQPITYQSAGNDYEINFLWKLFHLRKEMNTTEFTLGPLWNSVYQQGSPLDYNILGGFFARDVKFDLRQYRYRALWIVQLGSWVRY